LSEVGRYQLNFPSFSGRVPLWKEEEDGGFPAEPGGRDTGKDSGGDCQGWWHGQILK